MPYCTRQTVEEKYGTTNVQTWASIDNEDPADTDVQEAISGRIERAITWATERIDARFRKSSYVVPLEAKAGHELTDIADIAAQFARVWLQESRAQDRVADDDDPSSELRRIRKDAENRITRYVLGRESLPAVRETAGPRGPFVV